MRDKDYAYFKQHFEHYRTETFPTGFDWLDGKRGTFKMKARKEYPL